jgi:hypothetical protein
MLQESGMIYWLKNLIYVFVIEKHGINENGEGWIYIYIYTHI